MTRKIRLGAFLPGGGQHIAAWRHPDSPVDGATSFDFHVRLAQEAERGLFDAVFFADGHSVGDVSGGPHWSLEPLTALSAIRFAGEAVLVNYRPLLRPYTIEAIGGAELEAMRAIKAALDPQGLLNPGVIL